MSATRLGEDEREARRGERLHPAPRMRLPGRRVTAVFAAVLAVSVGVGPLPPVGHAQQPSEEEAPDVVDDPTDVVEEDVPVPGEDDEPGASEVDPADKDLIEKILGGKPNTPPPAAPAPAPAPAPDATLPAPAPAPAAPVAPAPSTAEVPPAPVEAGPTATPSATEAPAAADPTASPAAPAATTSAPTPGVAPTAVAPITVVAPTAVGGSAPPAAGPAATEKHSAKPRARTRSAPTTARRPGNERRATRVVARDGSSATVTVPPARTPMATRAVSGSSGGPPAPSVPDPTPDGGLRGGPGARYTVKPGDSLWSIARRMLSPDATDVEISRRVTALWRLNADRLSDPDLLPVRIELRLAPDEQARGGR